MAISFGQAMTGGNNGVTSATDQDPDLSWTGATAGDVCIIVTNQVTGSNTASTPAGWTLISGPDTVSTTWRTYIYKHDITTDTTSTVDPAFSGSGRTVAAGFILTGADSSTITLSASSPVTGSGGQTTITPDPITTTVANEWVILIPVLRIASGTPSTFSLSGYTAATQNKLNTAGANNTAGILYLTGGKATVGTETPGAITFTTSSPVGVYTLRVQPSATTSPVTPATRATSWNTLAPVTPATRATSWSAAATVTQTKATTYNVAATVTQTKATTWNVQAAVTPATRATTWTVLSPVTPATRATTWNVRGSVTPATRATTWNTAAGVTAATRATTWHVLGSVTPATRATTWNVASSLSAVTPATRATTWNVAATVQQTKSSSWNVAGQVTPATRATTWNVRASITPSPRATTWNVAGSVSPATRATSWNVRSQVVAATRGTSWNVFSTVSPSTRATTWNVKAAILATRATTWNVAASGIPTPGQMAIVDTTQRMTTQTGTGTGMAIFQASSQSMSMVLAPSATMSGA
jgi:hypothetical protein